MKRQKVHILELLFGQKLLAATVYLISKHVIKYKNYNKHIH